MYCKMCTLKFTCKTKVVFYMYKYWQNSNTCIIYINIDKRQKTQFFKLLTKQYLYT